MGVNVYELHLPARMDAEPTAQELLAQAGDVVKAAQAEPDMSAGELFKYVSLILGAVTLLVVGVAYGLVWYLDNYAPKENYP